jgi:site-specific recombinase XerD
MDKFKEWMALKGASKYTINQMSADVKKFLKEHREVNTRTVQKFIDAQTKAGKDSKTAYSKFLSLRKYAKFLGRELGEVEYPAPKRNVGAIQTMSIREFRDLSSWIRNIDRTFGFDHMRDKVIIILLMLGLRRDEMLNLKIEDFDFENRKIKFIGKMKKGAFADMQNQADSLKDYLDLRLNLPRLDDHESFLVREYNKRYKSLKAREMYELLYDLTGRVIGRKVNPHMFRHTIATLMLDENVDLMTIKDTLRHESILTTQIYTHVSKDRVKKALEEINPLFN